MYGAQKRPTDRKNDQLEISNVVDCGETLGLTILNDFSFSIQPCLVIFFKFSVQVMNFWKTRVLIFIVNLTPSTIIAAFNFDYCDPLITVRSLVCSN